MDETSISVEKIILSCMVRDYQKYYLEKQIARNEFKVELSRKCYDIITKHEANLSMLISEVDKLDDDLKDYYTEVISFGYITKDTVDDTFNRAYYQFKRDSSLGDMEKIATSILNGVKQGKSPTELMEKVSEFYVYQPEEKTIDELSNEILGDMEGTNEVISYKTGFNNLDIYLNGFLPGQFNVIAGTSSTGKSLIAVNFIIKHLIDNRKVAFFSLEMSNKETLQRMYANLSGVNMNEVKNKTTEDNYKKVKDMADRFHKFIDGRFFMYDDKLTLAQILSEIRLLKRKHDIDLVYIDYLGIISVSKGENRNLEIATITRNLKLLAKELKITIVALAQLNRQADQGDKIPELSHLRDSGAIGQDADDVIMAVNLGKIDDYDSNYTEEQKKQILRFYIRKNRNGPIGEADLRVKYSVMQLTDDLSFADLNTNPF